VTAANVGCTALLHAISRAKPLIYCFGHIHEAYRASAITWTDDETKIGANAIEDQPSTTQVYPTSSKRSLRFGNGLWWLNAATMGLLVEPTNSACVVELDLPPGKRDIGTSYSSVRQK
jgi:hypothetical protein